MIHLELPSGLAWGILIVVGLVLLVKYGPHK